MNLKGFMVRNGVTKLELAYNPKINQVIVNIK